MVIAIASGKGGTGKTLVATSLALSLNNKRKVQLLDCDVEEPDANIFLKPSFSHREMVSIRIPKLDEVKCNYCGKCAEVCAYNAIAVFTKHVLIFPELCHGCGACSHLCPKDALFEVNKEVKMPIYQYKCRECGEVSEFLVSNLLDSGTLSCPSCGNSNLERLISAPNLLKGKTTTPGTTCCGRTERCETPPCSTDERCWRP